MACSCCKLLPKPKSIRRILFYHSRIIMGATLAVEPLVILVVATIGVAGGTGVGLVLSMQCGIADVAIRQTYQIVLKEELPHQNVQDLQG